MKQISPMAEHRQKTPTNSRHRFLTPLLLILAMFGCPLQTRAQDEPLFDELMSALKQKHLSVGLLLQAGTDFQIERSFPGNNGFNISNARIDVSGELDGGFGYLLQAA
jgi:hypothetical protein